MEIQPEMSAQMSPSHCLLGQDVLLRCEEPAKRTISFLYGVKLIVTSRGI